MTGTTVPTPRKKKKPADPPPTRQPRTNSSFRLLPSSVDALAGLAVRLGLRGEGESLDALAAHARPGDEPGGWAEAAGAVTGEAPPASGGRPTAGRPPLVPVVVRLLPSTRGAIAGVREWCGLDSDGRAVDVICRVAAVRFAAWDAAPPLTAANLAAVRDALRTAGVVPPPASIGPVGVGLVFASGRTDLAGLVSRLGPLGGLWAVAASGAYVAG